MPTPLVALTDGHVDLEHRLVVRGDDRSRLTTREVRLLAYLSDRPNQAVSREELLVEVCDYAPGVVSRALDTAVRRLRRKIEVDPSDPVHVLSEHGVGYRFVPATMTAADPGDWIARPELEDAVRIALQQHTVVTLWGPGGIGKSTLAQVVLRRLGRAWVRVNLAGTGPDSVLPAAMSALGLSVDLPDPVAALHHALQQRDMVLLVDEAEGVVDAVAALLTEGPQVPGRVLITSRRRTGAAGERVIRVPPMTDAQGMQLLQCWTDRLGTDAASSASLGAVVQALDGLPLALELAAARTLFMSFDEQRSHLHADEPVEGRLRAAVRQSLVLLEPGAAKLLSALTLFHLPFSADDALAIAPMASVDTLQTLVDASLLQRTSDGRLRLLTVIRRVVLHDAPPTPEDHEHWMTWLTESVSQASSRIGRDGPRPMQRLRELMPEVLRAIELPLAKADPVQVHRLAREAHVASEAFTPLADRRRLFAAGLRGPEVLPAASHATFLATYALFLARTDGDLSAIPLAERAIALAESCGPATLGFTWHWLGRCQAALGDAEQGLAAVERAVQVLTGPVDDDSRRERAHALAQQGVLLARVAPDQRRRGLELIGEGLRTLVTHAPRAAVGLMSEQARLLHDAGEPQAAMAVLRRAAQAAAKVGDLRMECGMRANLGLLQLTSEPAESRVELVRAERLARHLGLAFIEALVAANLAWLDLFAGSASSAAARIEPHLGRVGRPWYRSVFGAQVALAYLVAGDLGRAGLQLDEARAAAWLEPDQRASAEAILDRVGRAMRNEPPVPTHSGLFPTQVQQLIQRFDRVITEHQANAPG